MHKIVDLTKKKVFTKKDTSYNRFSTLVVFDSSSVDEKPGFDFYKEIIGAPILTGDWHERQEKRLAYDEELRYSKYSVTLCEECGTVLKPWNYQGICLKCYQKLNNSISDIPTDNRWFELNKYIATQFSRYSMYKFYHGPSYSDINKFNTESQYFRLRPSNMYGNNPIISRDWENVMECN